MLATHRFIEALPAATRDRLDDTDVVLIEADGEAADYLADLAAEAVVVRPDRHVLGVASTATELDTVLARRPWHRRDRACETAAAAI